MILWLLYLSFIENYAISLLFSSGKTCSKEFECPDGINLENLNSQTTQSSVQIMSTTEQVIQSLSGRFSAIPGGVPAKKLLGGSAEYTTIRETIETTQRVITSQFQERAQFRATMFPNTPLHEQFADFVDSLLSANDSAAYRKLITYYGTHYVLSADFGGRWSMNAQLDSCYVQKTSTTQIGADMSGEFVYVY